MKLTRKKLKKISLILKYLILAIVIIITLFPIYYMISTAFKLPIQTYDPSVWVFAPTIKNFVSLFLNYKITPYLINSVIVTTVSVLLALALGLLTAYAFSKFKFESKEKLSGWLLSLRFVPAMSSVIPLFLIGNFTGLIDTKIYLILSYLTFNLPFAIWMLRGFIDEIPSEIEDAALVDGANQFQVLIKIIFPLIGPGLFATSVLLIIQTWNEFALALFLTSNKARTMPTLTSQFRTVRGVVWGEMTAMGFLTTLPVLIFAVIGRKYLLRGLTLGAVK